jgi:hypothetical protein
MGYGFTTKMLKHGLKQVRTATVEPICFVTRTITNAERIHRMFYDLAIKNGHSVEMSRYPRTTIIDGEAKYFFLSRYELNYFKKPNFSEVLYGNE